MNDNHERNLTQRQHLWEQISRIAQGVMGPEALQRAQRKFEGLDSRISLSSFNYAYGLLKESSVTQENLELMMSMLEEFGPLFSGKNQGPFEEQCYQRLFNDELAAPNKLVLKEMLASDIFISDAHLIFDAVFNTQEIEYLSNSFQQYGGSGLEKSLFYEMMLQYKAQGFPLGQELENFLSPMENEENYDRNISQLSEFLEREISNYNLPFLSSSFRILVGKDRKIFQILHDAGINFNLLDISNLYITDDANLELTKYFAEFARQGMIFSPSDISKHLTLYSRANNNHAEVFADKMFSKLLTHGITVSLSQMNNLLSSPLFIHQTSFYEQELLRDTPLTEERRAAIQNHWLAVYLRLLQGGIRYIPEIEQLIERFPALEELLLLALEMSSREMKNTIIFCQTLKDRSNRLMQLQHLLRDGQKIRQDHFYDVLQSSYYDATVLGEVLALYEKCYDLKDCPIGFFMRVPESVHILKQWHARKYGMTDQLLHVLQNSERYISEIGPVLLDLHARSPASLNTLKNVGENAFYLALALQKGITVTAHDFSDNQSTKELILEGLLSHYQIQLVPYEDEIDGQEKFELIDPKKQLFQQCFTEKPSNTPLTDVAQSFCLLQEAGLNHNDLVVNQACAQRQISEMLSFVKGWLILHKKGIRDDRKIDYLNDRDNAAYLAHAVILCLNQGLSLSETEITLLDRNDKEASMSAARALIELNNTEEDILEEEYHFLISNIEASGIYADYFAHGWLFKNQNSVFNSDPRQQGDNNELNRAKTILQGLWLRLGLESQLTKLASHFFPDLTNQKFELIMELSIFERSKALMTRDIYRNAFAAIINLGGRVSITEVRNTLADVFDHAIYASQVELVAQQCARLGSPLNYVSLKKLLNRYSGIQVIERDNIQILNKNVDNIIDYLVKNPHQIPFFENIAAAYDRGCVNQPVQAVLDMSSWVFVAEQNSAEEKLTALRYRYALESITSYMECGSHAVPISYRAEAGNILMREIHERLCFTQDSQLPWPHIPKKIAHEDHRPLKNFLNDPLTEKFIAQMVRTIQGLRPEDLIEYVLLEARQIYEIWGNTMFPDLRQSLDDEVQNKISLQKQVMSLKIEIDNHYEQLIKQCPQSDVKEIEARVSLPEHLFQAKKEGATGDSLALYEHIAAFKEARGKEIADVPLEVQQLYSENKHKTLKELNDELTGLESQKEVLLFERISEKTRELFNPHTSAVMCVEQSKAARLFSSLSDFDSPKKQPRNG